VAKNTKIKELTKKELHHFFKWFDEELKEKKDYANYTILGGAALVLLEIIDRSTADIDIVVEKVNPDLINEAAEKFGIEIDRVTQCTTVDFNDCPTEPIFIGDFLKIFSIQPRDFLKSKIERFEKQDPQDINALLKVLKLSYSEFKTLFSEMLQYFVGNEDRLKMKARTIVERNFSEDTKDFYNTFRLSFE
jgi:hypothetical protein